MWHLMKSDLILLWMECNIELVEVTEDLIVKIKWLGNCEHCSFSGMTMRAGVEQAIKSRLPEIKAVEAVNGYFVA